MTKLIEDLLALQTLLRLGDSASPEQKADIEALRAGIPEPILAHFLRQLAAGRKGVALVRNGVCGECHLRISHAMNHMLGRSSDLFVCENCGAFIAAVPTETAPVATAAPAAKPRRRRAVKKPQLAAVQSSPTELAVRAPATDIPVVSPQAPASAPGETVAA